MAPASDGTEAKPLRLSQTILDRELDRVYEAKTLQGRQMASCSSKEKTAATGTN